jgi:hypothetical protein
MLGSSATAEAPAPALAQVALDAIPAAPSRGAQELPAQERRNSHFADIGD